MNENEKHWLAGYLEGEGSFLPGPPSSPNLPIISVCSTDEDVIARVAAIFGVTYHRERRRNKKHKPVWRVKKTGYVAVQMMRQIEAMMSERRKKQIEKAIVSYAAKSHRLSWDEVLLIKKFADEKILTQSQIADKFGVRREWVNKIKNGKYHIVRTETCRSV